MQIKRGRDPERFHLVVGPFSWTRIGDRRIIRLLRCLKFVQFADRWALIIAKV